MKNNNEKGTVLLTLIIFMLIASIVLAGAVTVILSSSISTTKVEVGQMAYQAAESGIEEATLQLLRNPNFQGSQTNIPVGTAGFDITVSSTWPKTIDSYGRFNGVVRHIRTTALYNMGVLTVNPWKEVL